MPDSVTGRRRTVTPAERERLCHALVRHRGGKYQATVSPSSGHGPIAEITWIVGTPWQGRGIATEAVRGPAVWVSRPPVHSGIAHILPEHRASAAVATVAVRPGDRARRFEYGATTEPTVCRNGGSAPPTGGAAPAMRIHAAGVLP
ncbi:GNAT family N-acetyltransferase [Streptomyces iranensis]|uniref:GNAT family N-acetyltransferase n=1 Tax=Streptomyces iranensis TaxID=576784 RepID=UPI0039B781C7